MSIQNPLAPQGSLLEQKAKGKPYLRVAYVIVALHLLFLGGLLIQGCKRDELPDSRSAASLTNETSLPPLDSASLYNTNPPAAATNLPGTDGAQHLAGVVSNLSAQIPTIPQPVDSTLAAAREYVVLKGDSFYSIGKKFGVTTSAIAKANPGVDSTRLKLGDKLQIPASVAPTGAHSGTTATTADGGSTDVYAVKAGDTLGRIAKAHATTVAEIKSLNGLTTDRINVGQKLKLPPAKSAPATVPASVVPAGTGVPAPAGAGGNQ